MKISVITVVRNAQTTIADAIEAVAAQTYSDVEHIIIDGASTDNTLEIIQRYKEQGLVVVSEPDKGLYDAMNKGIALATGDVIGLLNADDVFQDDSVLHQVAEVHADMDLDACYADLVYVDADDLNKVARDWRSRKFRSGLCFTGWMPAHPTFYVKKRVYETVGLYNIDLGFQADLEFCARAFEIHKISSRYIPMLWVRMRLGGVTNNRVGDIIKGNLQSYKALKTLGLTRDPFSFFALKLGPKLPQFMPKFLQNSFRYYPRP